MGCPYPLTDLGHIRLSWCHERTPHPANSPVSTVVAIRAGPTVRKLRGAAHLVCVRPDSFLAKHLGLLRCAVAHAAHVCGARQHAHRQMVQRRAGQLCSAGVSPCRGSPHGRSASHHQPCEFIGSLIPVANLFFPACLPSLKWNGIKFCICLYVGGGG